ncbi:cytochrome P450 [Novosphingobium cyanobacteriorum]|uniref:Cytochrome P450 n=1 Tax=Novosphingobium cyanobacteriorum TaxID=3024215 RepID=A0ABT6CP32_9SPHN|nr:cytochrome P450 [Novosphingobium cyanobacteriorum]MDF8335676.1 cytochrome P450 [Novosphingobium cyanobacteriorum]
MTGSSETTINEPAVVPADMGETLVDPASFANPDKVHEVLGWLRANRPVAQVRADGFDPFWLITKHQDVMDIERQADIFHNGDRSTVLVPSKMARAIEATMQSPHLTRSVVNMDDREHRLYRALTQSWFMPGNVKKLTDRIRTIARVHVDRMLGRDGKCDFVSDVALHFPLHVVMEILGVPEEDEGRMLLLTQQLFGARDPELSRQADAVDDPDKMLAMFQAVLGDFNTYFTKLTADRRASPRDDVATVIANAEIDGKPIAAHEANGYYVLVATAGHDTTSASTAGAMWALAERPDLLRQIQANPALIGGLVDEAIRWTTPVKHFMRTATQDYELRGQTIKAGDWMMLSYLSANRDEDAFDAPFDFRVDREPNRQIAFGYGAHVCLGQHLAKLEMRILMEELLPRLDSIELDGTPAWTQSNFVSGPKRLPVRFAVR